jgi:hypothetical protein
VLRAEAQADIQEDLPAAALVDPEEEGGIKFPLFFAKSTHKNKKQPLSQNTKLTI